jgi:hypothetical protein
MQLLTLMMKTVSHYNPSVLYSEFLGGIQQRG